MDSDSNDSDYVVEEYIRPNKVTKIAVNDDSADLLGNFDDAKRKKLTDPTFYNDEENSNFCDQQDEDSAMVDNDNDNGHAVNEENSDIESDTVPKEINTKLSDDQLEVLLKGSSKQNRFVLYVTNLNFETTKEDLENFFQNAGEVKGIRIPKKRRGGFAFVEMASIEGFRKGFEFHNSELNGRNIKIQISEGGKKKSANKKNILRQKNRKLAEMRNERKGFNKSGKNYDKNIKKEKAKELLARKRWRKTPSVPH